MSDKFYITTPIYYPNAEPHLGHVYTTIASDAIARFHRLRGDRTFFLTGTDEHGIKMVKTAAAQHLNPQELADRNVAVFQELWKELRITHDDFLRTTEPRHKSSVQEIVRRLLAADDIYLSSYHGWYDESQEEFVTETEAKERDYRSAISGKTLVRYSEKSYFFRLSKYAGKLLQHIESHPDFIQPEARRNEVVSKLKLGVEDLSISRSTLKWGIPMPNDPEHVTYVWIDALSNYITALGYGSGDETRFRDFWPADVHMIGKEILWFHTVYWPAMLLSLGVELPRRVFGHGWWTSGGRKMSKSLGNFIDLEKLRNVIAARSLDALRYYLLRAAPFGSDLDWSDSDLDKSFNELANVVGNCLNRTMKMIGTYRQGMVPALATLQDLDRRLLEKTQSLEAAVEAAYQRLELQQCALLPVELLRTTNGYIDATQPFKLAKDPPQADRLDTVLNLSVQAIYRALVALLPILPEKAAAGLRQLGIDAAGRTLLLLYSQAPQAGARLGEGVPLFPKVGQQ